MACRRSSVRSRSAPPGFVASSASERSLSRRIKRSTSHPASVSTAIHHAIDSTVFPFVNTFSAVSFLAYATSCLSTQRMKDEFVRYGMARYRVLVGSSQLAGALGLLVGYAVPTIGALAASGFSLQMLGALGVRLKIGDSLLASLPAALYLALNAWLTAHFVSSL